MLMCGPLRFRFVVFFFFSNNCPILAQYCCASPLYLNNVLFSIHSNLAFQMTRGFNLRFACISRTYPAFGDCMPTIAQLRSPAPLHDVDLPSNSHMHSPMRSISPASIPSPSTTHLQQYDIDFGMTHCEETANGAIFRTAPTRAFITLITRLLITSRHDLANSILCDPHPSPCPSSNNVA